MMTKIICTVFCKEQNEPKIRKITDQNSQYSIFDFILLQVHLDTDLLGSHQIDLFKNY